MAAPRRPRVIEREGTDIVGLLSAGAILIILAVDYILNPVSPSTILDWIERMGNLNMFLKPPMALLTFFEYFFYAVAVWSILVAAIRVMMGMPWRRITGDIAGALFTFLLAFLIGRYAANAISVTSLVAYVVIGVGFVIILQSAVNYALRERY